ncbi:uncharacterized protein K452DRAFT_320624 [Aplosporella prunicola CBS 121167]|uniref:N-acetyltransferase domain-containing protein n=1 Tax=Aplosporella prunicola CBS 121167 TaxID=1176127 RepID=A0A6A6B5S0_9PEZI|nr:uncharacterized protein K452DRAFT_320624 [Aplosporella prunicola CBS 121167]KAF2138978.1 hypothetical protein K452DRAFT_320624 [Aplosporella prunicola CBS 121167]
MAEDSATTATVSALSPLPLQQDQQQDLPHQQQQEQQQCIACHVYLSWLPCGIPMLRGVAEVQQLTDRDEAEDTEAQHENKDNDNDKPNNNTTHTPTPPHQIGHLVATLIDPAAGHLKHEEQLPAQVREFASAVFTDSYGSPHTALSTGTPFLYLETISVDTAYRRKGIARALLGAVVREAGVLCMEMGHGVDPVLGLEPVLGMGLGVAASGAGTEETHSEHRALGFIASWPCMHDADLGDLGVRPGSGMSGAGLGQWRAEAWHAGVGFWRVGKGKWWVRGV